MWSSHTVSFTWRESVCVTTAVPTWQNHKKATLVPFSQLSSGALHYIAYNLIFNTNKSIWRCETQVPWWNHIHYNLIMWLQKSHLYPPMCLMCLIWDMRQVTETWPYLLCLGVRLKLAIIWHSAAAPSWPQQPEKPERVSCLSPKIVIILCQLGTILTPSHHTFFFSDKSKASNLGNVLAKWSLFLSFCWPTTDYAGTPLMILESIKLTDFCYKISWVQVYLMKC